MTWTPHPTPSDAVRSVLAGESVDFTNVLTMYTSEKAATGLLDYVVDLVTLSSLIDAPDRIAGIVGSEQDFEWAGDASVYAAAAAAIATGLAKATAEAQEIFELDDFHDSVAELLGSFRLLGVIHNDGRLEFRALSLDVASNGGFSFHGDFGHKYLQEACVALTLVAATIIRHEAGSATFPDTDSLLVALEERQTSV